MQVRVHGGQGCVKDVKCSGPCVQVIKSGVFLADAQARKRRWSDIAMENDRSIYAIDLPIDSYVKPPVGNGIFQPAWEKHAFQK